MIRLLNLYFNQRVAQHKKMFLWHLPQLKRKIMMMILELQIKLLSNLVGRQGCVQLLSGNPVLKVMLLDNDEPMSYGEAMVGPDSNKWLEAMKSEIGSMYENKVWTLVDLPDDRQAIENKWIFMKKTNTDGNVTIYEARLVSKKFLTSSRS